MHTHPHLSIRYKIMSDILTTTPGKIIIINGPSSSGKTTLALALQKQLDMPFIRFSFDLFLDHKSFPSEQIRNGTFSWEQMRPSVFRGLHQCIPALATAGNNIIFDHIIETKAGLDELLSLIAELDVFFVGLHCSLPELERREIQRGDRPRGEAHIDFQTVHNITSYDLELNSENPLDENIAVLLRAWRERKRPSALDRMIQEMNLEDHERFL
jgi:chloramphenicol 3-O phosphotransferase